MQLEYFVKKKRLCILVRINRIGKNQSVNYFVHINDTLKII